MFAAEECVHGQADVVCSPVGGSEELDQPGRNKEDGKVMSVDLDRR